VLRRKRVLVALGIVVGACSIYLWFSFAQYIVSLRSGNTARKASSSIPQVSNKIRLATDVKVVFLKGTALMTANADGSNVQTLVDDGVAKSDPHWSSAGDKIVYWTSGPSAEDSKILLNLVVVTADGQPVNTIPVLKTESGMWLLFHGADTGWYGNDAVFAKGMVNTVVGDYRVMDVRSGRELHEYSGTRFGTCGPQTKIAVAGDLDMHGKDFLKVNGTPIYLVQDLSQRGARHVYTMHWFADCSRLAFVESTVEGTDVNATLVVVSGTSVEAKIPIPAWMCVFVPVGSSFVVGGSRILVDHDYRGALLYDTTTHTLRRPDPDILKQLLETANREEQVMKTLDGQSQDWFRQEPSSISETKRTPSAPD
jgi:hypothetical protein